MMFIFQKYIKIAKTFGKNNIQIPGHNNLEIAWTLWILLLSE